MGKLFKCKRCGKITSSTNDEILKKELCRDCRAILKYEKENNIRCNK